MLIIVCTLLGLIGALIVRLVVKDVYQSRAKLLVRYVIERSTVDPMDGGARNTGGKGAEGVIGAELEILTSWDLALQVAEAIGPEKLMPAAGKSASREAAAATVAAGLKVGAGKGSNIIQIAYENAKPELTTLVLNELVSRYFVKHLAVHRSAGAFDFVSQQADQVRARLNQTEDALRSVKSKIDVASLTESMSAVNSEMIRTEEQLRGAEAELAEQRARVQALEQGAGGPAAAVANLAPVADVSAATSPAPSPGDVTAVTGAAEPSADTAPAEPSLNVTPAEPPKPELSEIERYKTLAARALQLRQSELLLLSKYTPEHPSVKLNRAEMTDIQRQLEELRKKYPSLVGATEATQQPDLFSERAKLAGVEAKTRQLQMRIQEVRSRFKQLSDASPQVAELERKKEMEEASYKYFQGTLEKARIDEALDPSKIPNISAVQQPTAPTRVTGTRNKLMGMLAGGGLALGIALALLNELVLNRTVKAPLELETLNIPLLLSIPFQAANGRPPRLSRKPRPGDGSSGNGVERPSQVPWDSGHFIRPYAEAIRDRLGLYFELNNLNHKPKLLGVTGFSDGAGISTLAAGLASALSEVDEGKVLLVDVKLGPGEVHPFFKGKPALSLPDALQRPEAEEAAADNLYLATVGSSSAGLAQLGLKKFFDMMPNLKASDFNYIVFDMPPLSPTSPTVGMAGFMDKLLLVVESEQDNRARVKRGYAALSSDRNNVSVILNKTRSYVPEWLDGEN